ncbi:D-alanyl-D-alanine carboxypeptidase [Streptomyces sp. NPDC051642]|uniref:D-alanyl-D-alanine carboxypeptidase n=1 Tax=Streptomyces sp. NPDC051642 TaxID=3154646 RepID=UPI0034280FC6
MEEASVAGESPDRSKKRESSAEPTPGSASPVPEARGERDPRLAVAREDVTPSASAAQRGGVDTATKIFSIRELRSEETEEAGAGASAEAGGSGGADTSEDADTQNPSAKGGSGGPEGDARLRAAVAAWVSSGSAGERPTADEDPEDAVEKSARSEAADGAEGSGDVATTEGSKDAETPAGGPETRDGEDAGEASVADASEGAESAQEADAGERAEGAGAGVTGDPGDAEPAGGDEARDSADAGERESGGDGDVTEGEQVAAAAAESDAGAASEDDSEADKAPVAATTGETGADADARPEATDTASGKTADAGSAKAEVDEAEADTAPEPTEGKTSPRATGAKPDGRPESAEGDTSTDASGPKTDHRPNSIEGKASTGTTAPKTDDRPKPAEDKASTGTTGPKADHRPESAEGKASTDATGPKADSRPEAAEGEGEPATGAVAAEGETKADPRTTGTGTKDAAAATADDAAPTDAAPSDAQPKAADDEKAPAGPPAPDNETRTGGAGGNTKAAEGEAEAVDHPTTVFKAPRPPKPAVDQPTTMLKAPTAPKTPKTPETPAERTSRFVALKPLDEPRRDTARPDATRPVPQVGPEHTTQQPLPPKPPLDLLAELTNTPPPPETPVRTAIRRVKIWTPLVILLAIVFAVVQAVRPLPTPSLTLTADDSYTFDGSKANLPWPSEGQGWMDVNGIGTMGNFGKQTPVAIGSVAKAMTAYIVLKDHPLKAGTEGEKITVDATAEKEGGYDKDGESTLNTVKAGDILTEKQALSAIMIPSANNIARLLARWDAGSESAFIKKMNDTAKSLGMTNTTYTDASGLKETTVSSAEDQVKLGNQLVKIQALMDITKLPSWVDPSGHKWTNYNRLVPYNNSLGIKTGTTTAAGGNLLFAATKEVGGETAVVVGAILGQHTAPIIDTVNAVSKTAMLAAQDAMTSAKILKKGTVVGYVDDQLGGHTPVVVTKDVAAVGWAGLKVKLSFAPDAVPHTAKAGTKVGTLTVGDGSSGAVKVPVALQKDLAEPALTSKLTRLG